MNISHPQNRKVLGYLLRGNQFEAPSIARPEAVRDPYYECGCHPDVVQRLWETIGPSLPTDCRYLVRGTPALVHPRIGVILAVGLGTQYAVRLNGDLMAKALAAGARMVTGAGAQTQPDLGDDWIFGTWLPEELEWCREVYHGLDT